MTLTFSQQLLLHSHECKATARHMSPSAANLNHMPCTWSVQGGSKPQEGIFIILPSPGYDHMTDLYGRGTGICTKSKAPTCALTTSSAHAVQRDFSACKQS